MIGIRIRHYDEVKNEYVAETNLEVIAIFHTTKLNYCMMTIGQL